MTGPREFRFAGHCRSCDHLIRLTLRYDINNNPASEWIRCADCDTVTRIPFIRDKEVSADE
jgi:RNase P subunit RPR2